MTSDRADTPPPSAPSRSRRHRRELRSTIASAAVDLVLARGLDAVTVDEIARASNVSRRTFFNYFPSKAAACIPTGFRPDAAAVERFHTDRSESTMTAVARLLWRHIALARQDDADFLRFHEIWRREPAIRPEVYAALARTEEELADLVAVRDGHPPDASEPAAVAAAAIATLRVAVEQWRSDEAPEKLEARIRDAFDAVSAAGRVDPGRPGVAASEAVPT